MLPTSLFWGRWKQFDYKGGLGGDQSGVGEGYGRARNRIHTLCRAGDNLGITAPGNLMFQSGIIDVHKDL